MNTRRSFLKNLFAGGVAIAAAPQIVTHGLKHFSLVSQTEEDHPKEKDFCRTKVVLLR